MFWLHITVWFMSIGSVQQDCDNSFKTNTCKKWCLFNSVSYWVTWYKLFLVILLDMRWFEKKQTRLKQSSPFASMHFLEQTTPLGNFQHVLYSPPWAGIEWRRRDSRSWKKENQELRLKKLFPRWWFQIFFLCSSLPGGMIQFDEYFSNGLKPPTSFIFSNGGWKKSCTSFYDRYPTICRVLYIDFFSINSIMIHRYFSFLGLPSEFWTDISPIIEGCFLPWTWWHVTELFRQC